MPTLQSPGYLLVVFRPYVVSTRECNHGLSLRKPMMQSCDHRSPSTSSDCTPGGHRSGPLTFADAFSAVVGKFSRSQWVPARTPCALPVGRSRRAAASKERAASCSSWKEPRYCCVPSWWMAVADSSRPGLPLATLLGCDAHSED